MNFQESIKQLDKERKQLNQIRGKITPIFLLLPFTIIVSLVAKLEGPPLFFVNLLGILLVIGVYQSFVAQPFRQLVSSFKSKLVAQYMASYHPDMDFRYQRSKKDVRSIIKKSKLIRPNVYKEEDVLSGRFKDTDFYLSEVDLKRKSNNSVVRLFKGMMFQIKIPGRNLPHALIQSKVGLVKKHFQNFRKHPDYNFQYSTSNEDAFHEELGAIFPFIQHLISKQGDVRVETKGNEILILLESKENFLDSPKTNIQNSFERKEHYANFMKQINSFLYIVEAFSTNLQASEIEEQLELKMLEIVEREGLL